MNGTVAPPSSKSTAARTCSGLAVMSWAMRCSMLSMGLQNSLAFRGATNVLRKRHALSVCEHDKKGGASPEACVVLIHASSVEMAVLALRPLRRLLLHSAIEHVRTCPKIVQALLALRPGDGEIADNGNQAENQRQ